MERNEVRSFKRSFDSPPFLYCCNDFSSLVFERISAWCLLITLRSTPHRLASFLQCLSSLFIPPMNAMHIEPPRLKQDLSTDSQDRDRV